MIRKIDHGGKSTIDGKTVYDPFKTLSYTYYANGMVASMADRNGKTTTYKYDIHGRLLSKSIE